MLYNISDALTSSGYSKEVSLDIELNTFDGSFGSFELKEAGKLELKLVNESKGKATVSGFAEMIFNASCDRCLKDVSVPLNIEFERTCSTPESELDEDDESRDFMDGYSLDIEALLYNEITVNWPIKILCREDCKGLCPVCGKDRNEVDCGCDTFVPDPRMAALKDIFDSTKEV